jgi:hypothetical protein
VQPLVDRLRQPEPPDEGVDRAHPFGPTDAVRTDDAVLIGLPGDGTAFRPARVRVPSTMRSAPVPVTDSNANDA